MSQLYKDKMMNSDVGLTFDDVLIAPQISSILTREECSTEQNFFGTTTANPLIPSNMDTITESEMLEATYDHDMIGFLHRYMTLEKQVMMLKKALENYGEPTSHFPLTIGVNENLDDLDKVFGDMLYSTVLLDVAHAGIKKAATRAYTIKRNYGVKVIAGNVATRDCALRLVDSGVDGLKVGIGNGSICSTRLVTGCGVPQIHALLEVNKIRKDRGLDYDDFIIISDGGINYYGDIAKAIVAGANFVMSGKLFAGCSETPGLNFLLDSGQHKVYRGMASKEARMDWGGTRTNGVTPEGVSTIVPSKGYMVKVAKEVEGALKSTMSYVGVRSLRELYLEGKFITQTSNGVREGETR